jgi:hypothetical protein
MNCGPEREAHQASCWATAGTPQRRSPNAATLGTALPVKERMPVTVGRHGQPQRPRQQNDHLEQVEQGATRLARRNADA